MNYYTPTTLEELHLSISDEDILYHYFGNYQLGHWYKSPLREEETDPSFTISYYNGIIRWRDFGRSPKPKNAIEFVKIKFNLELTPAIYKVYNELVTNKNNNKALKNNPLKNIDKDNLPQASSNEVGIKVWKPKFKSTFEYWGDKYDFSKKELLFYKVLEGEVWNNKRLVFRSSDYTAVFIYMFSLKNKIWKGYRPNAKANQLKFFSNNILNHTQNWKHLNYFPNKDILFITKSYKDCMILNKLGYNAIAPHGESSFLMPWEIDHVLNLFTHVIILYDNDSTGIKKSTEFAELYNLPYNMHIPLTISCKDSAEVVEYHSYKLLNDIIIDNLIKFNI